MGSVIAVFILFLVLRRFDVVGAMSVGSSGVLFYSSMRRDEMRGVSWHEWKRSESLPQSLSGDAMKLLISLNVKPDLIWVILLRVADGKIGADVGVILRKTNVGQSDRECAADSLNTIGCRYCAMAFFQSRRSAVRGAI
jgi:hypothetical protein